MNSNGKQYLITLILRQGQAGTFVWFAGLEDLIAMKRAAGRPKDLEDLKYLLRLRRRRGLAGRSKRR